MEDQVYYELSWAILSTICIGNVLFGITIIAITRLTPVSLVPIIVSAAGAIANGMCYYAFYADYPRANTAAASVVADIMWLIQEAGITFYSYMILTRLLPRPQLTYLRCFFWPLIFLVSVARIVILIFRVSFILNPSPGTAYGARKLRIINSSHIAFFIGIALIEIASAFFLVRTFIAAKKSSAAGQRAPLFRHLMRSTEIRQGLLAVLGVTRAVTYFFQPGIQKSTNIASQIDRFVYTLECLFPMMLYIDILASRITALSYTTSTSLPHISPQHHPYERQPASPTRNLTKKFSTASFSSSAENPNATHYATFNTTKPVGKGSFEKKVLDQPDKAKLPWDNTQGIVRTVEVSVNRTRNMDRDWDRDR